MATTKRPQAPIFKTPRGTFVFPKINEPDYKFKKEGEFSLKLRVTEGDDAVQDFIATLRPLYDAAIAKADQAFKALPVKSRKEFEAKGVKSAVANPLYSIVYDEATEEPTGEIEFKFSLAASGTIEKGKNAGKSWVKRPAIVNERGEVVVKGIEFKFLTKDDNKEELIGNQGPNVWGGTVGKVNFEVGLDADGDPGYFVPGTAAAGLSLRLRAVQFIELVSGGERDYGFGNEAGDDAEDAPFERAEADF